MDGPLPFEVGDLRAYVNSARGILHFSLIVHQVLAGNYHDGWIRGVNQFHGLLVRPTFGILIIGSFKQFVYIEDLHDEACAFHPTIAFLCRSKWRTFEHLRVSELTF